ncbi:RNA polymerase sigma factor [Pseudoclavibacter sp. AY1F1]|uniref:RNA polymerase sigma factor n=1 Tax=Pseudoclavibacter sp. AY1F1 TaxID=2080583 RepID=UPI001C6838F0|nr:RNA polymerase sigma factor [Pseudoclavibacter sp. AY1F1]
MSTDSQIIERSRADPAAFAELYDRHHRLVHRYAARRTNQEIADDLLSETFLVAFEQRGRFDPTKGEPQAWLLGIATTLLKKHRRVEEREWRNFTAADAASSIEDHDFTRDAESRLDAYAQVRRLRTAVNALAKGDRDALLLYAWGDLDYEGVAAALGIPIGTVRSRLNRARRKLQRAKTRLEPQPHPERPQNITGLETDDGRDRASASRAQRSA